MPANANKAQTQHEREAKRSCGRFVEAELDQADERGRTNQRRRSVKVNFGLKDQRHFAGEDITDNAARNASDNSKQNRDRSRKAKGNSFARAEHRKQRQRKGIGNQQNVVRQVPHSNREEGEQSDARGVQQKFGAAQPNDWKIPGEQVANRAAAEGCYKRKHQNAKKINPFAARGKNASYRRHRDAEMFETSLKCGHYHARAFKISSSELLCRIGRRASRQIRQSNSELEILKARAW